MVHKNLLD